MPKSHHSRGKRTNRNKQRVMPVAAVSTTTAGTASQPAVKAPAPSVHPASPSHASAAVASALAYPDLMSDLKKIGILAGIAVVILLILYFVLA